ISAFSNTEGGRIFIGISNSGKIIGTHIGKGTVEKLANNISQHTDPEVYPRITTKKIEGKDIIIIEVKESPDHLVLAFGRPFKRVGKSTRRMSKDEYERLILEKHREKLRFDNQFRKGATLKDIDWKFVEERFIPLYEKVSGRDIIGTPRSILESLGCIEKGKPTNAAILLFGKNPQKFFMNAYIAIARYKGRTIGGERLDYKEFRGNIIEQIDNCDKYIKEHITVMSQLLPHKVEREDIPEYGLFSIRELITNALCHRDYKNQHSKVIIKLFDNRIEFYNPGGLPDHITPKNIIREQFSRNPLIAKVLAKIRYIEELGEGWDKIIDEHKNHPLKPKMPKINAESESVLVTLFSTKEKFKGGALELNNRQRKAISYVREKGKITNSEYQSLNKTTKKTATRDLLDLVKREILIKKGITGKGVYYTLNPAYRGHKGT
ncbi:putative DNA binding domain-containing protein, partial [bacterium]|nr:putative DNA binding domain-containing protein [bacterium]